jgi:hypothetical protein
MIATLTASIYGFVGAMSLGVIQGSIDFRVRTD